MKQSTQDILREYRELFPDISEKELFDEIKNFQKLQEISKPNTQYKKDLKLRLKNLYTLENLPQKTSILSWFQYVWILTSFVFIFGLTFSLYEIQKQWFAPAWMQEDTHLYEAIEYTESQWIPDNFSDQPASSTFENNTDVPKNIESTSDSQLSPSLDMNTEQRMKQENEWNTSSFQEDVPQWAMMMESRTMMVQDPSIEAKFVCEENFGTVSEDAMYCSFQDNTVCKLENIESCLSERGK